MKVPLLDLKAQYESIRHEVDTAIARVIDSQHFILGPEVEALEQEIATYSGCHHAIGLSSGTDAILVALMALDIGPGDEVITSPNTFIATASCIARLGAKAVFIDIDPTTYNLDVRKLEAAITPRTQCIMPVHLFGQMADMDAVIAIASRRGVPVIEDGAQAIGSEWRGKRAGSYGTFGCFSFFPSKNLGAFGDAGALVTSDSQLAKKVKMLRVQGQEPKYFSKIVGGNFRIDALQAAILRAKLPHLDAWTAGRQKNAALYRTLFREAGFDPSLVRPNVTQRIALPQELPNVRHIYNQFVIRTTDRDALRAHLSELGIGSEVYYPQPMHLQTCFQSWGYTAGSFPEAESAALESLAIPVYPELTRDHIAHVVSAITGWARSNIASR